MRKILLPIFALFFIACTPQVTVTSEVTVTLAPPTETPIPTPTLIPTIVPTVTAINPAILDAQQIFADYGYNYSDLDFSEDQDGRVIATDSEGKVVYEDGKFDLNYAVEQAGQLDLMKTNIEPDKTILEGSGQYVVDDREKAFTDYFKPLFERARKEFVKEYGFDPAVGGTPASQKVMLNPEINAWGSDMIVDFYDPESDHYFYYELRDETIHIVPLL